MPETRAQFYATLLFFLIAVMAVCTGTPVDASQLQSVYYRETAYRSTIQVQPPFGKELNFQFKQQEKNPDFQYFRDHGTALHAPGAGDEGEKVHKLELVELVIEEFDLFAGLRSTFHSVEEKMAAYVERMRLKGGVNFSGEDAGLGVRENLKFDGGIMVRLKEAFGRKGLLKALLPDHVNWSVSSDLSGAFVIGELEIGRYFFVEGSVGDEGECRMIFEVNF